MLEYMIVSSSSMRELETKVCKYINSGWAVQGGIATDGGMLLQAVVYIAPPWLPREEVTDESDDRP